jgi:hypothetical protein
MATWYESLRRSPTRRSPTRRSRLDRPRPLGVRLPNMECIEVSFRTSIRRKSPLRGMSGAVSSMAGAVSSMYGAVSSMPGAIGSRMQSTASCTPSARRIPRLSRPSPSVSCARAVASVQGRGQGLLAAIKRPCARRESRVELCRVIQRNSNWSSTSTHFQKCEHKHALAHGEHWQLLNCTGATRKNGHGSVLARHGQHKRGAPLFGATPPRPLSLVTCRVLVHGGGHSRLQEKRLPEPPIDAAASLSSCAACVHLP